MRLFSFPALVLGCCLGAGAASSQGEEAVGVDCWFDKPSWVDAHCYEVRVPASHDDPDGEVMWLPVAVFSIGSNEKPETPVILINGGPGGATFWSTFPEFDAAEFLIEAAEDLMLHRDVVLYDQRGVGLARPNLNCPELDAVSRDARLPMESHPDLGWVEQDAERDCALRLGREGIDLDWFSTPANADDLAMIIGALGHEQADLWALSYGTRVGLAMLRQHPDMVRSVVLDSVDPQHIPTEQLMPEMTAGAFQRMFDDCRADSRCNDAFPDLAYRFERITDRLNAVPREITLANSTRWDPGAQAMLTGNTVIWGLYGYLYDTYSLSLLPNYIHASLGDLRSPFSDVMDSTYFADYGLDEALFMAIWCRERFPFVDQRMLRRNADTYGVYGDAWRDVAHPQSCDAWPVEPAAEQEIEPVSSDIPVLLISGAYDPRTPPAYAEDTARYLSNSRHMVFRGAGHTPSTVGGCAAQLVIDFFENPDPAALQEPACKLFTTPPRFELHYFP